MIKHINVFIEENDTISIQMFSYSYNIHFGRCKNIISVYEIS